MMTQWKYDWMHSNFVRTHVAIARFFVNGEIEARILCKGTGQRRFYTVKRLERGVGIDVPGKFQSLEEAKAAA